MKDFVFPYELKVDRLSFGTVHLEIEGLRDVEATIDAIFEELKKAHRPELLEGLNPTTTSALDMLISLPYVASKDADSP